MTRSDIIKWVEDSFQPIKLSMPRETKELIIESSITYFNTHSAYKIARMFNVGASLQLSNDIKTVISAYPCRMDEYLFTSHPMWVLLGMITLDRYTQDLMLVSHTFEGYRIYLGNDFRWKFIRSEDSTEGGWLYLQQIPESSSKVAVVGTKRIIADEDITDEFIYNWLREHAKAKTKVYEGNILRKAQIIGIANDGQNMVDEGMQEMKDLEEALRKEGRWAMLGQRK